MLEGWIKEIKEKCDPESVGMILAHNGIVRGTSKAGEPVKGMNLTYDKDLLGRTVEEFKKRDGISEVKVWINEGELAVGDDIMYLLVAGRFRTDVLPALEALLTIVKRDIVKEVEKGA